MSEKINEDDVRCSHEADGFCIHFGDELFLSLDHGHDMAVAKAMEFVRAKVSARYEEGLDYVVCPECGSHILIEGDFRERLDEVFGDLCVDGRWECFTCDWWECEADFDAYVMRDRHPAAETAGEESEI